MEEEPHTDSNKIESINSEHHNLYKYNGLLDNQHKRRRELLENIKKRRSDAVDELRGIGEVFQDVDEYVEEPVDTLQCRYRQHTRYGAKLMLSEWMSEVPVDLEETWLFKICPVGVRNIVVAYKGATKVYNRRSQLKGVFQSALPGGNKVGQTAAFTILDCIYRNKTYYVLDLLVWNSHSLFNCSTEFRFFFLKNKILETPELTAPTNNFKFINIDYHTAFLPTIEEKFASESYTIDDVVLPVDGILFYHKDYNYRSGQTPLVGWLKPYMVPEQLHIPVNQLYMARAPKKYTNLREYLKFIWEKRKNKKSPDFMETEIEEENNDCMHE